MCAILAIVSNYLCTKCMHNVTGHMIGCERSYVSILSFDEYLKPQNLIPSLSPCLSVCLFVCLSVCLSLSLSLTLSLSLSMFDIILLYKCMDSDVSETKNVFWERTFFFTLSLVKISKILSHLLMSFHIQYQRHWIFCLALQIFCVFELVSWHLFLDSRLESLYNQVFYAYYD